MGALEPGLSLSNVRGGDTVGKAFEEVLQVGEPDGPLGIRGDVRLAIVLEDVAAELEGVLAAQIGDVIGELQDAVGPDDLGPAGTQSPAEAKDTHSWKTEIEWI